MPQNDVSFIRTNGIGRRATSLDHVSGIMFYTDSLPAGFTVSDNIKPLLSLQDAEDLGIVDTHTDETVATGGNALITTPGSEDDVNKITIDGVTLGSYTVANGDDAAAVAVGLRAAINALTIKHGFSAAGSTANVAITAPAKMGAVPNNATLAFSSTGTGAATMTQFSSGAGSLLAVMHYHISDFFRIKPDGKLWIGLFPTGTFDATEISDMRAESEGEIRQIGVFIHATTFASSQLSSIQTELTTARTEHENIYGVMHADCSSLTLSNLANLTSLSNNKVQPLIGEDGNYHQAAYSASVSYLAGDKVKWLNRTYSVVKACTGEACYDTDYFSEISLNLPDIVGYSVSTLGNMLGNYAKALVSQSPANPELFPQTDGNTLSEAGFASTDLYKDISTSLRNQLNDYHYTYIRTFPGVAGVYYNDSYTATAETDDYATGENNRTMDKAERLMYTALVPKLSGTINLNEDGTLSQASINEYEAIVRAELESMLIAGEVSAYDVEIDATQDILQNSELQITVTIVPLGIARKIVVNNAYAVKIQ
jgi:hypothetical protein